MRKGFLFSTDALLAAILLIGGLLLVIGITNPSSDTEQMSSASQDLVSTIDEVELHEISDPWVQGLLRPGNDTDGNLTVLEQIGLYWAAGNLTQANQLASSVLNNAYPGLGVKLVIGTTTIYNRSSPKGGTEVIAASRMMTGVAEGEAVSGSSAAAYLRKIENKRDAIFIPFGGFVGEGNFSVTTGELPSDANVTDVILEVAASKDFDIWINGNSCDNLTPVGGILEPDIWNLNCTNLFVPGSDNVVSLNFSGDMNGSYVAGGFVKVLFRTDTFGNTDNVSDEVYRFPHVQGLINLFDGMYVAGTVHSLNISLYFLSNYTSYLTIGNASWQFTGSENPQSRFINESQVTNAMASVGMNLTDLNEKTIPIRFGIGDVVITGTPSDTVIVTDTSGSMGWCVSDDSTPPCTPPDEIKLDVAKTAVNSFIDYMLNNTGPLLGLVEFGSSTKSTEALTNDDIVLKNEVNSYAAGGGTCICCGINDAASILTNDGQVLLIPRDSAGWTYNDQDLSSPPAGWTDLTYDDSSWSAGDTPIGFVYFGLDTVIPWGNRYIGDYYFRHKFNVTNATDINSVHLFASTDDGADIYVNGNLVDSDYGNAHTAIYWNRDNVSINPAILNEGENVIAVRIQQSTEWWQDLFIDVELAANYNVSGETRTKNILAMSDGEATGTCAQQGTGDPKDDAIQAACDAYNNFGITTYTVGFGNTADAATLEAMANCSGGEYFEANDSQALNEAFSSVGSAIIQQSSTQRAILEGTPTLTAIYSNSTINANFTSSVSPLQPNEISITVQSDRLSNCSDTVRLFRGSRFVDATVTSYSDEYWTSQLVVNNQDIYNLSEFALLYSSLGDPYRINVPVSDLIDGNNTVNLAISTDAYNQSPNCSLNNTVVYTLAINLSTARTDAVPISEGCNWVVEYVDGTFDNLTIPSSYSGQNNCTFNSTLESYDSQDAYQLGAYRLLDKLDFSNEGRLYVNLAEEDLEIVVTTISGVPYLWGPAIARVEVSR